MIMKKDSIDHLFKNLEGSFNVEETPKGHQHRFLDKLKEQNRLEQVHNNLQTRIINATIDAKEKERKSIAEILHDSVSALLSSANLHLQASKAQLNSHVPVEIIKAQEIVKEASVKIRDLSHELISSVLLKFGLAFRKENCNRVQHAVSVIHLRHTYFFA